MSEQENTGLVAITAKDTKKDTSCTVTYDFGKNLDEALEKFDPEVIFTNFRRNAIITAQAAIRRMMGQGLEQEAIQGKIDAWKPGVAMERVIDPVGALLSKFESMSVEDQEKLLMDLKSKVKG